MTLCSLCYALIRFGDKILKNFRIELKPVLKMNRLFCFSGAALDI